jgi:Fe-S oxidoreductase
VTGRTGRPLPVHPEVASAAAHGQWCPKLCSHTCPVLRATGRADAVPWSFHRTVADLAEGRLAPEDAVDRLVACTGCGACADGCEVEGQDVPAQVRAGRAAVAEAGAAPAVVHEAIDAVRAGRSPFGVETARRVGATRIDAVLVAGCRDAPARVAAAVRLLAAAGQVAEVLVPRGCCGAALRDLRAEVEAAGAADVTDLVEHLAELVSSGRLALDGGDDPVRWHEPCALRGSSAEGAGRSVLTAIGTLVELPGETRPGCSGGGLGLPLLDLEASVTVAADRLRAFAHHGPLVTACSGAAAALSTADEQVVHLVDHLDSLLDDTPESVA